MKSRIMFFLKVLVLILVTFIGITSIGWFAGRVHAQQKTTPLEVVQRCREFEVWRFVDGDRVCYVVKGEPATMAATGPISISCAR